MPNIRKYQTEAEYKAARIEMQRLRRAMKRNENPQPRKKQVSKFASDEERKAHKNAQSKRYRDEKKARIVKVPKDYLRKNYTDRYFVPPGHFTW